MTDAEKYSKMAEELLDKARNENSPYTKFELGSAAQIYSLLAQRAQGGEGSGSPRMTSERMSEKLEVLTESDAKGLQRQIFQHFTAAPLT
jgi:hypothetical protein